MRRKGQRKRLYLICSNDRLQTAFFCGTAAECVKILGFTGTNTFHSAVSKKTEVFFRFAHIEAVPGPGGFVYE